VLYHPDDVDLFIAVADAIEDAFPSLVVEGEETEDSGSAPDADRLFKLTVEDGRVLFQRSNLNDSVDPGHLVELLAKAGARD